MRKLKHHEFKLLKKADFLQWKKDASHRSHSVIRRYRVSDPEDYYAYNRVVGMVTKLVSALQALPAKDPVRAARTEDLLNRLFDLGVISKKDTLAAAAKVTVSAFCRRRLPVVMVRLKFAENLGEATALVEQGHVRIGTEVVREPALCVTREMEDVLHWVDTSKIKKKVAQYNDEVDDYDLMA